MTTTPNPTPAVAHAYDPRAVAADLAGIKEALAGQRLEMAAEFARQRREMLEGFASLLGLMRGGDAPPPPAEPEGDPEAESLTETQRWARGKFPPSWQAAADDFAARQVANDFANAAQQAADGFPFDVAQEPK